MTEPQPETNDQPAVPDSPDRSVGAELLGKALEASASAIPVDGGPLAVVIATLFNYSYSKRIERWQHELTEAVQYLMDHRGVSVEDLAEDDEFLDAVATATRIVAASGSEAKRKILRNALINIGSGEGPEPDKQAIYLRYIDELTPSHMRLLDFMNDPVAFCNRHEIGWPNIYSGSLGSVINVALPEFAADRDFLDTLGADLSRFGLVSNPGFYSVMTGEGIKAGRGTAKGSEFLAFISSPLDLETAQEVG